MSKCTCPRGHVLSTGTHMTICPVAPESRRRRIHSYVFQIAFASIILGSTCLLLAICGQAYQLFW